MTRKAGGRHAEKRDVTMERKDRSEFCETGSRRFGQNGASYRKFRFQRDEEQMKHMKQRPMPHMPALFVQFGLFWVHVSERRKAFKTIRPGHRSFVSASPEQHMTPLKP